MTKLVVGVAAAAAASLSTVSAHGSMITPRPRNSIDWLVGVNTQTCSNLTGSTCEPGQAAFWYSQGCYIGCPSCDHMSGRVQTDLCGLGVNATITDPHYRSVNLNATAGSPQDIYRHNPWRRPGSAPTADVCGLAGGTPWGPNAPEAGDYVNTTFAHHGMNGSLLGKLPSPYQPPVWTIGGEATVSWNVRNNHGGGYAYRLCPATEELTEECFQRHHLEFVLDRQAILYPNGTQVPIIGAFVNEGTSPPGSTWSRIPIPPAGLGPRCLPGYNDTNSTPWACQPWEGRHDGHDGHVDGPCAPCPETPGSDCSRCDNSAHGVPAFPPPVEGVKGSPIEGIVDVLRVPSDLPPGDYVLGFRYDCEATAQVWANCADIVIVNATH